MDAKGRTMPQTRLIPIYEVRLHRTGSLRHADRELNTPDAVVALAQEIIAEQIADYDREHFVSLYLNAKNRLTGYHVNFVGTLTATMIHPREIIKGALLTNAHSFIIAHNHPSGNPKPSQEDKNVTAAVQAAGRLMAIDLLDSLVIGHDGRYTSFRSKGILND